MKQIAVIHHSGYGHTAKVADAVAQGLTSGGTKAVSLTIDAQGNLSDEAWAALDSADGIIFGTPTYMGGPSWQFKKFADASSRRWMKQQWKNKIAAGFTNSGSLSGDKLATLQQLITLAMQHGMVWVGANEQAPAPKGADVPQATDINRMGSYSGLMTQSNNESSDIVPPSGDLETARRFGKRIAEITAKFSA